MGLFSKIADLGRNGAEENIECLNCSDTYRGNIDRNFPYAICGRCLEKEAKRAKGNGDNSNYQQAINELERRRRTFWWVMNVGHIKMEVHIKWYM